MKFSNLIKGKATQSVGAEISKPTLDNNYYVRRNGLDFTIHKAVGGYVIEAKFYDPQTDMSRNGIYVIPEDKDIGEEISKILTIECLKL